MEMPSREEAQAVIAGLNGTELMGRALNVNEAEADAVARDGRGGIVVPGEGSKMMGRKRGNASWTNGCKGSVIGTGNGKGRI